MKVFFVFVFVIFISACSSCFECERRVSRLEYLVLEHAELIRDLSENQLLVVKACSAKRCAK